MNYTIEKADSGWNIFQSDPPTARYSGKRFIVFVKGPYENAYARLLEFLNSRRALREAISRHGAIAVGAANFSMKPTRIVF